MMTIVCAAVELILSLASLTRTSLFVVASLKIILI